MKVLVVGSTGALGVPTMEALVAAGHETYGLTRTQGKAGIVTGSGARAVFGDVLDETAADRVVAEVRPDAVVQLLNALPKRGAFRPSDLDATNELRRVGTRHMLAASRRHGVRRFLVESMIFGYGYGDQGGDPLSEDAPFGGPVAAAQMNPALQALDEMEKMVLDATNRGEIEGVVLRLGLFYGPEVGSTKFMMSLLRKRLMFLPGGGRGKLSWIHVADGASAIVAALEKAPPGAIYNVVDDEPVSIRGVCEQMARRLGVPGPKSIPVAIAKIGSSYAATMAQTNLRVSNARIKEELGWQPRYPTYRDGVADLGSKVEVA
jgi:nucleoside-diphosphate-sugar epimerase